MLVSRIQSTDFEDNIASVPIGRNSNLMSEHTGPVLFSPVQSRRVQNMGRINQDEYLGRTLHIMFLCSATIR